MKSEKINKKMRYYSTLIREGSFPLSKITLPVKNDPITTPKAMHTAIMATLRKNASTRSDTGNPFPNLRLSIKVAKTGAM